jgi:SSS family solute:Na+ symporter
MQLHFIDVSHVVAYLGAVTALGLWVSRGAAKTTRGLFLADRSLPWWAIGTSLVVSDIGAKDMVGLADDGYRYGLVMTNFDFLGCVLPVLVAAFVFMPFLWMAGVYTIPEYLGRRYNQVVRSLFAFIWGVFMVGMLAVICVSAASIFESILGWSFWTSVAVTAGVVGVYTTFGGLKAVVMTDFISCIVLIVGAALICIFGLIETGGWSGLQEKIAALPQDKFHTEHHFDLMLPADGDTGFEWPAVILGLGFVLGPAYWIGNQAIVQRSFGAKSQNEARAAYVLCAAIKLVFPLLLVVPGLIGLALFHEKLGPADAPQWKSGGVLPQVVQLLPRGVLGIVLGAFLSGVMNNLDSYVNSAATLWVNDFYRPLIRRRASDRECVNVGRLVVVLMLVGGAVASYYVREVFSSVYSAFQTFMSLFQGALFALLLLGMLTKRATGAGGIAGLVCGVGSAAAMVAAGVPYLWISWWSFVAALAATIVVSLLTKAYSDERLEGLVYWLPSKQPAAEAAAPIGAGKDEP